MKKFKSFFVMLFFAALVCTSCFSAGSTKVVSNDGKTKLDIVGTWVLETRSYTNTVVFNKNGTFTAHWEYHYSGAERVSIGPDGEITTRMYVDGSGTYKIIDGNILQRTYTKWWSNTGKKAPGTTNRELRVLGPNQFLISDSTFTRKN